MKLFKNKKVEDKKEISTHSENNQKDVFSETEPQSDLKEQTTVQETQPMVQDNNSPVVIDDTEDSSESLEKTIEKKEEPKVSAPEKKTKKKIKKESRFKKLPLWAKIVIGGISGLAGLFLLGFIILVIYAWATIPPVDDRRIIVDNPDDPLGYTNTAIMADQDYIPLIGYTVQGIYTGFEEKDVYKQYRFLFDQTGYYEGYSSADIDDFGKWEILSNGDEFYLEITCTEAKDSYHIEYLDGGRLLLFNRDVSFTLTPEKQ